MKRTPKLIAMLGQRRSSDAQRLNDENLKTLHSYVLLEFIAVRGILRQRGLHADFKVHLVDDQGHMF
jgi:hypothetical protein